MHLLDTSEHAGPGVHARAVQARGAPCHWQTDGIRKRGAPGGIHAQAAAPLNQGAPLKDGGLSGQMHRNRLNSTLPSIIRAVDGDSDDVQELPSKDASTGASTLFQDLRDLARDEFSGSSSKEGEVSGSDPDDASSQFSILVHKHTGLVLATVIMTASKAAANKVIGILEPRLQSLELIPRNPTKVEPQRAPQGDEYASSDIVMTGSCVYACANIFAETDARDSR
eukprot:1144971-Pelagomonas_calceolata.AAC.6